MDEPTQQLIASRYVLTQTLGATERFTRARVRGAIRVTAARRFSAGREPDQPSKAQDDMGERGKVSNSFPPGTLSQVSPDLVECE